LLVFLASANLSGGPFFSATAVDDTPIPTTTRSQVGFHHACVAHSGGTKHLKQRLLNLCSKDKILLYVFTTYIMNLLCVHIGTRIQQLKSIMLCYYLACAGLKTFSSHSPCLHYELCSHSSRTRIKFHSVYCYIVY
jgi:hypothetical protein